MVENVMQQSRIPTDKVLTMRGQNLSNNQIISTLQRDGHDLPSIFSAMNQADIKSGIDFGQNQQPQGGSTMVEQQNMQGAGLPEAPLGPEGQQNDGGMQQPMQPMDQGLQQPMQPALMNQGMQQQPGMAPQGMPAMGGMPVGQPIMDPGMNSGAQFDTSGMGAPMDQMGGAPMGGPMGGPAPMGAPMQSQMPVGYETQRIEELAEAIIDEKWNEIVRSINKIVDWKERVEARVNKLEQRFDDMHKNFELLHKGVLGKVHDYDQNLQNVGAEIKAMEKVFQKVLPSLTESVSELGRITKNMKKK
jgi:hypothetical protein